MYACIKVAVCIRESCWLISEFSSVQHSIRRTHGCLATLSPSTSQAATMSSSAPSCWTPDLPSRTCLLRSWSTRSLRARARSSRARCVTMGARSSSATPTPLARARSRQSMSCKTAARSISPLRATRRPRAATLTRSVYARTGVAAPPPSRTTCTQMMRC